MNDVLIDSNWTLDILGTVEGSPVNGVTNVPARVPGSVLSDLIRAGLIPHPYENDNEEIAHRIAGHDFLFRTELQIDDKPDSDVELVFAGIDTIAEVRLNDVILGSAENMHRTHRFPIGTALKHGPNELSVLIRSPLNAVADAHSEDPVYDIDITLGVGTVGYYHLRKAHAMFGWDWAPKMPDSGIWKPVHIRSANAARIDTISIRQTHVDEAVQLMVDVTTEGVPDDGATVSAQVYDPDGNRVCEVPSQPVSGTDASVSLFARVPDPQLWWPNGSGEQPLYTVEIVLATQAQTVERRSERIGLRTIAIDKRPDEWGEAFTVVVNGVPLFIRGANHVLHDSLLPEIDASRVTQLVEDCADANFNMIRVWGGGIYPTDAFFDACDEAGILVWQDFMFSSLGYPDSPEFRFEVAHEVTEQIQHLRNHPSLALWCGNNEMEFLFDIFSNREFLVSMGVTPMDENKLQGLIARYVDVFETMIPDIVRLHDPDRYYHSSSPTSGGGMVEPNGQNCGDVHFWDVWGFEQPIAAYRTQYSRFCSEFGFQSLPGMSCIRSFMTTETPSLESPIMTRHQKSHGGNEKLLRYMDAHHSVPEQFDDLVYVSQILQAEAVVSNIEHMRRNRRRCMGSLYWQLTDCWPAVSWSSIDYSGHWKALHYAAKRAYAPVAVSTVRSAPGVYEVWVSNESPESLRGTLTTEVGHTDGSKIHTGEQPCSVDAYTAVRVASIETEPLELTPTLTFCSARFRTDASAHEVVSRATSLGAEPKDMVLPDPGLDLSVSETDDSVALTVHATTFARGIELYLRGSEARVVFDDNFFDLAPGESRTVHVLKGHASVRSALRAGAGFQCRSLADAR